MDPEQRDVAWFHELDAWTEYWDVYHPESHGRFYFGDGEQEAGLLTRFLPRQGCPKVFRAWTAHALAPADDDRALAFVNEVKVGEVAEAVMEVDALLTRLFATHFGDARLPAVRTAYLDAVRRFATDTLPPATERLARMTPDDPRWRTAGRHTLDGDMMWFAWAMHTEAAHILAGCEDAEQSRRALMQAGVAAGCATNFAWRGHRRTRPEYSKDDATTELLRVRGEAWATDFDAALREVHGLYRIRERGED